MFRKTFDIGMTAAGGALAIVLLVAGVLLFWGYSFADSNVHTQLRAQRIYFPKAGDPSMTAEVRPYIGKYAGRQLVTGAQAEAYANHYIAVHLKAVAGGKTYSEVSALSRANPNDAKLSGQVQTLFRGETLRGLLLNAFAFWKIGQLARIGSMAAFAAASVMGLMTSLGIWHIRRDSPRERFFARPAPAKRVNAA